MINCFTSKKKVAFAGIVLLPLILTGCNANQRGLNEVDNSVSIEEESVNLDLSLGKDSEIDKNEEFKINKNDILDNDNGVQKNNSEANNKNDKNTEGNTVPKKENALKKENIKEDNKEDILTKDYVFFKSDITDSVKSRMVGKSMPEDSTISFNELSYLTITYLGYDGKSHQGEMVVHKKIADEVLEIFKEIYQSNFPIEKMRLIDDYGASDYSSMVNNNTSAFCYRTISGTNKVSNHGKGVAIDINPFYNPHVLKSKGTVNPVEASKYSDRSLNVKGMIKYNDVVYKAFISRGWTWGGHWSNPDYQHFEKTW